MNKCTWQLWAVTADKDGIADHFHELVPDMALEFPFELDKFQKEVETSIKILCLYAITGSRDRFLIVFTVKLDIVNLVVNFILIVLEYRSWKKL